eukprot:TRINITY_DN15538_c0_g1_i1.p1 TRINITY_DN15538_c0_g1~~TRINITY_DN15538_c0_g1_i1.p1  ORF type:complete len:157 (+),score=32.68 TRINITY_DN15538_c0_g1_i1:100-570(+)
MFSGLKSFLASVEKRIGEFQDESSQRIDSLTSSIGESLEGLSLSTISPIPNRKTDPDDVGDADLAGTVLLERVQGAIHVININNRNLITRGRVLDAHVTFIVQRGNERFIALQSLSDRFATELPKALQSIENIRVRVDKMCSRVDNLVDLLAKRRK